MGQLSRANGVTPSSRAVSQARVSPKEACHGTSPRGPLRADRDPCIGLFHQAYPGGVGEAEKG